MENLLADARFDSVKAEDKSFIAAFDREMERLGYTCGQTAGDGYCWGRYMIVYVKKDVKSRKSYARIYIRDSDIVVRLYFSNIDRYREKIESAPAFVRGAFAGDFPRCEHCHGKSECIHQKRYTIHDTLYEVCDGRTFWFFRPDAQQLPDLTRLFSVFYPPKKIR